MTSHLDHFDIRFIIFYYLYFVSTFLVFFVTLNSENCDSSIRSYEPQFRAALVFMISLFLECLSRYFGRSIGARPGTIWTNVRVIVSGLFYLSWKLVMLYLSRPLKSFEFDGVMADRLSMGIDVNRSAIGNRSIDYRSPSSIDCSNVPAQFHYFATDMKSIMEIDRSRCLNDHDSPKSSVLRSAQLLFLIDYLVYFIVYSVVYLRFRIKQHLESKSTDRSIWWSQIDFTGDHWHIPDEMISILAAGINRKFEFDTFAPYRFEICPVINLDTTIDFDDPSMIYSILVFDCYECCKDNGIYLVITSTIRGRSRSEKISRLDAAIDHIGKIEEDKARAFVQNGTITFYYNRLLVYNIRRKESRLIDLHGWLPRGSECFYFLKSDYPVDDLNIDGNQMRVIYYLPIDDGRGFSIRQCLLEIPFDPEEEIKFEQLQEITYGLNWRFTDHYRLIRTSRGEVGIIGELVDSNVTTDEEDEDGARWTTCVMYSPETRRLSVTGDYEKYLQIDSALRRYFEWTITEYESLGFENVHKMHRFDRLFLCPHVLTVNGATVVRRDGSISNIDFEPRSLKWHSMKKLFDAYGMKEFEKYRANDWRKLTGVELEDHFWD